MGAVWCVGERRPEVEALLQRELGVPPLVAALLGLRGYDDPATAERFLRADLKDLHDPRLLPDYEAARDAILGVVERGGTIFVHGDYDVDGVTSAALLTRFLTGLGARVVPFVPHRRQGYGLRKEGVDRALAAEADLLLTCDCGSTSHEAIAYSVERGLPVVVTDHHTLDDELPPALAVVNPHREDAEYPFLYLSGVGIAFKLCLGLARERGISDAVFARRFLDLAALGTVADVMPLLDENRIIVTHGLVELARSGKVGIRELLKVARAADRPLVARDIGFGLGPRINAVGRMDDAAHALALLLTKEESEAVRLAGIAEELNVTRRGYQDKILEEARADIESRPLPHVIVAAGREWNKGVVGIVAGRIKEMYRRPTFVGNLDDERDWCSASGRSIEGFDLASAIRAHPNLLQGGGHGMAAGVGFRASRLEEVRAVLDAFGRERIPDDAFVPRLDVCFEVSPQEVTLDALEQLSRVEPFGMANPEPLFAARNVSLRDWRLTKNGDHVQITFEDGSRRGVKGVMWRGAEAFADVPKRATLDVAFTASVDTWGGDHRVQWTVCDFASGTRD